MKTSALTIAACAASLSAVAYGFTTAPSQCNTVSISRPQSQSQSQSRSSGVVGPLDMFSGGALDVEEEEDDEKREQMEQMAKAMGMSMEEYQLGINARMRMEESINDLRVVGGDAAAGVSVERDGNMPPKHLVVTITEEGKGMGKEKLEKAIVDALKGASEKSKVGRDEAQKDMMKYISESMKKMGSMQ